MRSGTKLALITISTAILFGAAKGRAQSYWPPATAGIVDYVKLAIQRGDLQSASSLVERYRRWKGDTPEALEALSWIGRGELAGGRADEATKTAEEIKRICQAALGTRKLDAEPHLPIALGAAYEIEAGALAESHQKAEAIRLLQSALRTWAGTSIVDRLQKNLNELTLAGRPMPILREPEWIGKKPEPISALHGKVLLLFFWAHWCADCKAEGPIIAHLGTELGPKGLAIIAPTRLYGYTATDEHAPASEEKAFIERVYQRYYANIPNAEVPIDSVNFEHFGASTTPTLVLVDRRGIVRLYHPGVMDEATLRSAIEPLLTSPAVARAAR